MTVVPVGTMRIRGVNVKFWAITVYFEVVAGFRVLFDVVGFCPDVWLCVVWFCKFCMHPENDITAKTSIKIRVLI